MKIALVGEFSSLHRYLKEGLEEIGEEVLFASNGDGFKAIKGEDIQFPVLEKSRSLIHRYHYSNELGHFIKQIQNFDVVQIASTNMFSVLDNSRVIRFIKGHNKRLSLVSAGSDYAFFRAYKTGKYQYHPFNYFPPNMYYKGIKGLLERRTANQVEEMSDIIIPSLYDYVIGFDTPKLHEVIPFPINTERIEFEDNVITNKIVFFHGLNREIKKGTPLIREAMERLRDKYPNDVEIVIDGHMPFDKYIELMKRVNVVIDQTYGYGYGINSCLALAQGKIVANPCKEEQIRIMNAEYNPFITIYPSVDDIYQKLCEILERKTELQDMAIKGRQFVERYHNYIDVSQKYLDAWKSTMIDY